MAGNADWLSELPSITKKDKNAIHNSTKMTPIQASKKVNEKIIYNDLEGRRVKQKRNISLGDLVRTSDNRKVFSKRDSTKNGYEVYTIPEVTNDTFPSYRINDLPERSNGSLLLPTKLSFDEINKVMKALNLFQ